MQVVVLKSYEKRSETTYNYGDDYEVTWHNFKAFESVMELSNEEYSELLRAIALFNSKKKRDYTLQAVVVMEDNEVDLLLSDFRSYEKAELDKAEIARKAKVEEDRLKREQAKAERALKKLAKELNLSVEEVRAKLAK
jgi:hypothetical protein